MLELREIRKLYPEHLHPFGRSLLREYLQYKILQIVFDSPYADRLSFLGGTALRIVHNNRRFSEDLDFDNFGLSKSEFESVVQVVRQGLEREGYIVETRTVSKGAYRCYIRLPRILFDNNLSGYEEEKILIQIDTLSQGFSYIPEKFLLQKFEVFTEIFVTPVDVLLSQKIYALFNRKRPKGRDFFDIAFLFPLTRPNYEYLDKKLGISDPENLRMKLKEFCSSVDLQGLAHDVQAFLFDPKEVKRVLLFERAVDVATL